MSETAEIIRAVALLACPLAAIAIIWRMTRFGPQAAVLNDPQPGEGPQFEAVIHENAMLRQTIEHMAADQNKDAADAGRAKEPRPAPALPPLE